MDCIVNVTQNWGIGKDGDLLVSIPTDLRRFRALTTRKTVIYGRKTLLTFPPRAPAAEPRELDPLGHARLFRAGRSGVSVACGPAGSPAYPSGRFAVPHRRCERLPRAAAVVQPRAAHADPRRPACRPVFPDLDRLPNWRCTDTGPLQEDGGHCFRYLTYENDAPLPL